MMLGVVQVVCGVEWSVSYLYFCYSGKDDDDSNRTDLFVYVEDPSQCLILCNPYLFSPELAGLIYKKYGDQNHTMLFHFANLDGRLNIKNREKVMRLWPVIITNLTANSPSIDLIGL